MKEYLKAIQDIPRDKLPKALLMGTYFFLVITIFWVLKPMKKIVFIGHYVQDGFNLLGWQMTGSEAEQLAKIMNMILAAIGVVAFTWLSRRMRRQRLVFTCSLFFIACFILFSGVVNQPTGSVAWAFYLFGDFFNTVMVVLFWAFLNDIVSSDEAKRIYGICGLGGVLGGWFGSVIVAGFVEKAGKPLLLLACVGGAGLIMLIAYLVSRIVKKEESLSGAVEPAPVKVEPELKKTRAAWEGAKLVLASRYLLAIVAVVGCYEIVSTIMDFQWTRTVEAAIHQGTVTKAYFGSVYMVTNSVAVFVQFFLTSLVMRKFGVGVGLLFLPVAAFCGSTAFILFPVLMVGNALSVSDNGLNYSINQSSKEALYVPTPPEVKYRAKAFIDMFVMRLAKAFAVIINLVMYNAIGTGGARWLSLVSIAILLVWISQVRYAGRQFENIVRS